jgi:hypothetical protein
MAGRPPAPPRPQMRHAELDTANASVSMSQAPRAPALREG